MRELENWKIGKLENQKIRELENWKMRELENEEGLRGSEDIGKKRKEELK